MLRRARAGFSLIELTIVTTIFGAVMVLAFQTFIDANKAKSTAIASGVLKGSGQTALNDLYKSLHQSRHLFDNDSTTTSFFGRLPIVGLNVTGTATCSPGVAAGDLVMPKIELAGSFMAQSATEAVNPNFSPSSVGNALFYATVEPKAIIGQGAANDLTAVYGATQYFITAYRLHFYFLARRPLRYSVRYRGTSSYDYELMHWQSQPYLDYKEMVAFMSKIVQYTGPPALSTAAATFINQKLSSLSFGYAGALDLQAPDAATSSQVEALSTLTATPSHSDLVGDPTSLFKTYRYASAVNFNMRDSFGEPMICYNTFPFPAPPTAATIPAFDVPGIDHPGVPAYATQNTSAPYGFEVMIAGPPNGREILIRMTLAAVTTPGEVHVGEAFQQIVQVYDY